MTADLRAALRAAVLILLDPVLRNDENTRVGAAERFRALADAPPTVAELLPRVDAGHEVHWTSCGEERRARSVGDTIAFDWRAGGTRWFAAYITGHDLSQPARLVEVAP